MNDAELWRACQHVMLAPGWRRRLEAAAAHCQAQARRKTCRFHVPRPVTPIRAMHTHCLCCVSRVTADYTLWCQETYLVCTMRCGTPGVLTTVCILGTRAQRRNLSRPEPSIQACAPMYDVVCIRYPKNWTGARCQLCSYCSAAAVRLPACLLHLCAAFPASSLPPQQAAQHG